ncbi:eIF2A-related protein, partial [Brasilonema bromeliae]
MTEGNIKQTINGSQYAAMSATGDVFMYVIHNYREDDRTVGIKPADTSLEDLDRPCPYRGLSYFETQHAELFFGRNSQIDELKTATQHRNFIPILGASGSGKSSLVFAGLIPKLAEQGNWLFTYFRLGSHDDPFYAIAEALLPLYRSDDEKTTAMVLAQKLKDNKLEIAKILTRIQGKHPQYKLLLIADQFEQLYTSYKDEIQHLFLDLLLSIIQASNDESLSTVMVTTMRADFLDKALSYPPFAEALKQGDIKLGSMTPDKLEQVIEKPALKYGVTFQDGLVERILGDIYNKEDCLPLLAFALEELWNKRTERLKKAALQGKQTDRQLTHEDYTAIGQVKGALATYADDVYNNLTLEQKEQVPKIFIQLVNFSQFTKDRTDRRYVRRVAKKTELGEKRWRLVQILAEKRLVVTNRNADNEDTVEIIHETLIKQWPLIETWMNENRDFGTWLERMRAAMSQWEKSDRDSGALLRGKPLADAEDWLQKHEEDLTNEKEYIHQSLQLREQEKAEKERQELEKLEAQVALDTATERNQILTDANQKAKKKIRYSNIYLAVSVFLGAVFLGSAAIAINKQLEAQKGTKLEQAGVNALRQMPSGEIDALLSAMQAGQELKQMIRDNTLLKDYPATSPLLALQKIEDSIHEQNRIDTGQEQIKSVSFSPDGKYIATAGKNDTVILWSPSGEKKWIKKGLQRVLADSVKTMNFVAFSPDGKKIAAGEGDGTITLWDLSGNQLTSFKASTTNFKSLSFSPDGQKIATADEEKARLWDLWGKQLAEFVGHKGRVNSISFNPNGQQVATAGYDGTVRLWEVSGKQLKQFTAHKGQQILSLSFSPDGKYLTTAATGDNTALLWNLSAQDPVKLEGHQGSVLNVGFSRDGKIIATTSNDGTVRLWDLSGKPITTLQGHRGAVSSASFSPDGKYLVTGGVDNTARIWNLSKHNQPINKFQGHQKDVNSVSFSSTGQQIVTADHEGIVKLWNLSGQEQASWQADRRGPLWSVNFSPDGQLIATGGYDNTVAIWDLSGKLKTRLKGHKNLINNLSFSPNGQMIVTSGADKTARLWNLSGKLLTILEGHQDVVERASFSPDEKTIATGGWDGNVIIWDLSGHKIKEWQTKQGKISGLSFSPDGKQLATADKSGVIKIWNLSGNQPLEFFSYQTGVSSLSFSPNGQYLASGGMDSTVRLWNLKGYQIAEFKTGKGAIWGISFSPDGKSIVAGGDNGVVQVWQIKPLDELLSQGCDWLENYRKNPAKEINI